MEQIHDRVAGLDVHHHNPRLFARHYISGRRSDPLPASPQQGARNHGLHNPLVSQKEHRSPITGAVRP